MHGTLSNSPYACLRDCCDAHFVLNISDRLCPNSHTISLTYLGWKVSNTLLSLPV